MESDPSMCAVWSSMCSRCMWSHRAGEDKTGVLVPTSELVFVHDVRVVVQCRWNCFRHFLWGTLCLLGFSQTDWWAKTSCKRNYSVILQRSVSLNVNSLPKRFCLEWPWHVSHTGKQWKGPSFFSFFFEAVAISALLRAIWGILRHSGGNIQRCFCKK